MSASKLEFCQRRIQRGVYAIEFAVVFLFFFALLYAVLCYGVLFTVRLGMQNAAEEGARAGLRFQPTWAMRLAEAERHVQQRLTWMKYPPVPRAQLCEMGTVPSCRDATGTGAQPSCHAAAGHLCQIVVSVSYAPFANSGEPWLPPLPAALLPAGSVTQGAFTLTGRASMLLDERAW